MPLNGPLRLAWLAAALALAALRPAWSHGYMYEPASRNSPNNIVTGKENCGTNGGKPGKPVRSYRAGQVVDTTLYIYQEHGGQYSWFLCPKKVGDADGWDCDWIPLEARLEVRSWWPASHEFNRVPQRGTKFTSWSKTVTLPKQCLQGSPGNPCAVHLKASDPIFIHMKPLPGGASWFSGAHKAQVRLPKGVGCEHCTLRWYWAARAPLSPPEHFTTCADIKISGGSPGGAPPPPAPPFSRSLLWTNMGCLRDYGNKESYLASTMTAAVRCCAKDKVGQACDTMPGGRCLNRKASFAEAKKECARAGMRLCTKGELLTPLCCDTGCRYDERRVWSSTVKGSQEDKNPEVPKTGGGSNRRRTTTGARRRRNPPSGTARRRSSSLRRRRRRSSSLRRRRRRRRRSSA